MTAPTRVKLAAVLRHDAEEAAQYHTLASYAVRLNRTADLLLQAPAGVSKEAVLAILQNEDCRCGHVRGNHSDTPYCRPCSRCAECPGYRPKIADPIAAIEALPEAQPGDSFQRRVDPWLLECFGEEIARDKAERNHRFLEESLELVQACGCAESEAHQLVAYVYGRPVGEIRQECGGVMVTLAALCLANGLDMHEVGEVELARIWTAIEKIQTKQANKPKSSALPGARPEALSNGDRKKVNLWHEVVAMMKGHQRKGEKVIPALARILAAEKPAPVARDWHYLPELPEPSRAVIVSYRYHLNYECRSVAIIGFFDRWSEAELVDAYAWCYAPVAAPLTKGGQS